MIRVVVIDDHPLFAQGTVEILRQVAFIEPVGYALGLEAAIELVKKQRPDVVLCDVMLGDRPRGFELPGMLARSLTWDTPVIFLSHFGDQVLIDRASSVGGAGYLLKTVDVRQLGAAIAAVASGGTVFPKSALSPPRDGPRRPTPREAEILTLVADGASTGEVAARLGISDNTVETHLARLFARYGMSSRTQLAVMADRHGWLNRLEDLRLN